MNQNLEKRTEEKIGNNILMTVSIPMTKYNPPKTAEFIENVLKELFDEVELIFFETYDIFDEIEFCFTKTDKPERAYDVFKIIRDRVYDEWNNLLPAKCTNCGCPECGRISE